MTLSQINSGQRVVYAQGELFDNMLFGKIGKVTSMFPTPNGQVFVYFDELNKVIQVDPVVLQLA